MSLMILFSFLTASDVCGLSVLNLSDWSVTGTFSFASLPTALCWHVWLHWVLIFWSWQRVLMLFLITSDGLVELQLHIMHLAFIPWFFFVSIMEITQHYKPSKPKSHLPIICYAEDTWQGEAHFGFSVLLLNQSETESHQDVRTVQLRINQC